MTTINDNELLTKVKAALGIGGTYQDATLSIYIDDVKSFLQYSGVASNVINSTVAVGVICRGVADLWNYGSGQAQFSEYFKMRVSQLVLYNEESGGDVVTIVNATLNVDGEGMVKSGYIELSDGNVIPVNIATIERLDIVSTEGTQMLQTMITVSPQLEIGNHYRYKITTSATIPAVGEDLSGWTEWNGTSEIEAEPDFKIIVAECDKNAKAIKAGATTIKSKLF